MNRTSAGILLYRTQHGELEVLLAHPGGPFFRNKHDGAWTIPKGEVEPEEDLLESAKREFQEEIGVILSGPFVPLAPVKQKGGKIVHAWACSGNIDPSSFVSNTFTMEWPPKSGKIIEFPEVDQAIFYPVHVARTKINPAQIPFLDELLDKVLQK